MKKIPSVMRKNYKKIIAVSVILMGILLVWGLSKKQEKEMESIEEIHEKINNTEFLFLKGIPSIIDEEQSQDFYKIITDETEMKEFVDILKTTEITNTTQNELAYPLDFFYIYTLIFYDKDGKQIDEYTFEPNHLFVKRENDNRIFALSEANHYKLLEISSKSILQEPDFSLVFNNVLENPIEVTTLSDGRKVYSFFEENQVINQEEVVMSLQDVLKEKEFF